MKKLDITNMSKLDKGDMLMTLLRHKTFNGNYFDMNKYYIPEFYMDDLFNWKFEVFSHNFLDNTIEELSKLPNAKYYDRSWGVSNEFLVSIDGVELF